MSEYTVEKKQQPRLHKIKKIKKIKIVERNKHVTDIHFQPDLEGKKQAVSYSISVLCVYIVYSMWLYRDLYWQAEVSVLKHKQTRVM